MITNNPSVSMSMLLRKKLLVRIIQPDSYKGAWLSSTSSDTALSTVQSMQIFNVYTPN